MSKETPKAVKATCGMDDAFPLTATEKFLEEIVDQNEEIILLLKQLVSKGTTNGQPEKKKAGPNRQQSNPPSQNEVAKS